MENQFSLFSKLSENPKLITFCNRVIAYNNILMFDESRKVFLESLQPEHISNKTDIKEIFDIIWFISETLKLMILEEDTIKYIRDKFEEIQHYQLTEYKYEINKSINGDELCITNPIIPVSSLVVACFSEVPYYSDVRKVEGHIRSTYNQMEIIKHIDGNIYNNDIDNLITNCENTI